VITYFLAAAGKCGIDSLRIAFSRGCGGMALSGLPDAPASGLCSCILGA